jgi:hypothetical protein
MNRCSAVGRQNTDDEFGAPRAEGVDCPGRRYGRPTWRQRGTPDDVGRGWVRGICGSPERYEGSDDQRACWGCRWSWMAWLTSLSCGIRLTSLSCGIRLTGFPPRSGCRTQTLGRGVLVIGLHSCRSYLNYGLNARQSERLYRHGREDC